MGASNILKNKGLDIDSARVDRNNRVNPPEYAPGQEDSMNGDDDLFSSSFGDVGGDSFGSLGGDSLGGSGGFGSDFGGSFGGGLGGFNNNQANTQVQKSDEDKVFDALKTGSKEAWGFFKDIIESFNGLRPKFWAVWGSRTLKVSLAFGAVGLILTLAGHGDIGWQLLIGSVFACACGVGALMFNTEKAREDNRMYADSPNTAEPSMNMNFEPMSEMDYQIPLDSEEDDIGDEFGFGDDDGVDFEFGDEDEDLDGIFNNDVFEKMETQVEPCMSADEALNSMPEINKGMLTRQYLYDCFTKVLPNVTPDFATIKSFDEDDNTFIAWSSYLIQAAEVSGMKEDNYPELISLQENLFTIILTVTRTQGFKADAIATELATIYAYSEGEYNPLVYAKSDLIGKNCEITVFTGDKALITIKDMYKVCKDFVLDSKYYIPVVFGVDQNGKVITCDLQKLESILVTGMPRMGKSWFVQSILIQMCAFVPPSELHLYICDPKEGISDFKAFKLPHVKKFVSGDDNIVSTLRNLVKVEAPRRKKIIGDADNVNIWDFKERYPDVKLPIIYILIDEVVTLAERMEKETKAEFQGLLIELISQLPALGIRAFLIPHVVKNDIIAKTATDLIPCRVSVCGDATHIESCTGTKAKDFPFKLTNKGDMAVKMPLVSPNTMYVHGSAISESNVKNNEIFDYMRRVWSKLEPEEIIGSVAEGVDDDKFCEDLVKSSNTDDFLSDIFNDDLGDTLSSSLDGNSNEKRKDADFFDSFFED